MSDTTGSVLRTGPCDWVALEGLPPGAPSGAIAGFEAHLGGWLLKGTLEEAGGHLILRSLTVGPRNLATPAGGVSSTLLRSIPTGGLLTVLRAQVVSLLAMWPATAADTDMEEVPPPLPSPMTLAAAQSLLPAHQAYANRSLRLAAEAVDETAPKRGRKGYPEDHYKRIALAYLELQNRGFGQGILTELAHQESLRRGNKVPRETVRTWVYLARYRYQFLTPGTRGQAGAMPGPRLYLTAETSGHGIDAEA